MFVIFDMAVSHIVETGYKSHFTRQEVMDVCDIADRAVSKPNGNIPGESRVYCIHDFPRYECEIDFDNPHMIQNELNKITELVGDECPVGKAFGVSGIGEGVVWRCIESEYDDSGYWFKVKDERHSNSKVKTLATVDVERINDINELAEQEAHNGRLEQMHQTVFDTLNGGETDIKRMGDFIKAVMADIAKEDMDVIAASGFTWKEVSGPVSKICREFVMKKLEF